MLEPLQEEFMRRAIAEIALIGLAGGALGCWIVLYEFSYAAESLAHSLFPGLVVAALTGIPLLSLDEILARTDAVTADDLAALVDELYDPTRLSAAAVGGDEDVFKRALEAVNPELVAA